MYHSSSTQKITVQITPIDTSNQAHGVLKVEELRNSTKLEKMRIRAEKAIHNALKIGEEGKNWNLIIEKLKNARTTFSELNLVDKTLWTEHIVARIYYTYIYDLKKSIRLSRELIENYEQNDNKKHAAQAKILLGMAMLEKQKGDSAKSISQRRSEAQKILQEAEEYLTSIEEWALAAWAANNLGLVYFYDKKNEGAFLAYKNAIRYAKKSNLRILLNRIKANHALVLSSVGREHEAILELELAAHDLNSKGSPSDLLAIIYQEMANLYFKRGSFTAAIQAHSKSLENATHPADMARSMLQLGYIYLLISENDRAETYYNSALEKAEEVGEVETLIAIYRLGAAISDANRKPDIAISRYLKLIDQATSNEDKARIYMHLSDLNFKYKRNYKAKSYSEQAINTLALTDSPYLKALAIITQAKAYRSGPMKKLLLLKDDLISVAHMDESYFFLRMNALYILAYIELAHENIYIAEKWSNDAVKTLRTHREEVKAETWSGFFHTQREIHKQHIKILYSKYLLFKEHNNQLLSDKIASDIIINIEEFRTTPNFARRLEFTERVSREKLDTFSTAIENIIYKNNSENTSLIQLEKIRRELDISLPEVAPSPLSKDSISNALKKLNSEKSELIIIWMDDEYSLSFILYDNKITITKLPSESLLHESILDAVNFYSTNSIGAPAKSFLFEEVLDNTTNKESMKTYLITDSFLSKAPFNAATKKPLLHLTSLNAISSNPVRKDRSDLGIAIFSDPEYKNTNKISSLPGTNIEAKNILAYFSNNKNLLYEKSINSRDNLLTAPYSDYRYIHIAAHSFIDFRFPNSSYILLSGTKDHDSDSIVTYEDIRSLKISADLVTLSSCSSNFGRNLYGTTTSGLNDAFFHAGAKNVLTSLWQVPDQTTEKLMTQFYAFLTSGESLEDSLYYAQNIIRQEKKFPYYWAGWKLTRNH